ncbi:Uncharacterized protein DBV15_11400, partial [Temnothorax longispinosus]
LSPGANVIKANLRGVLSQPAVFKRARQRAPTDFDKYSRATAAYFKKQRLSCDLKFILDHTAYYRQARPGATPVRDDVSSRRFPLSRVGFFQVQLCFPRCFEPLLPPAAPIINESH